MPRGAVTVKFLHGNKLEEDAVVRHEPQQVIARILGGDEPFGAWIDFDEAHAVAADLLAEEIAIWIELRAPMDEQAQLRPDLRDARLARDALHVSEEHEHPCRYTAQDGDRQPDRLFGQPLHLRFPIT
jgi:hypothetical protein